MVRIFKVNEGRSPSNAVGKTQAGCLPRMIARLGRIIRVRWKRSDGDVAKSEKMYDGEILSVSETLSCYVARRESVGQNG